LSQLFPEWTNKLPTYVAIFSVLLGLFIIGFVWYYFSPWYTDVGYRPEQPVPYSHKLHVDDLGLDCRYCHNLVEKSAVANVPPTQTCMNCHKLILPNSEKLLKIRESWSKNIPMKWIRVHKLPDFVYFDHHIHLNAGIGCVSCHGQINEMPVVTQKKPLSMSWCLDCHKHPEKYIRPVNEVTNMRWVPPDNQLEFAERMIKEKNINPPIECSGCHR
jgi:hypothetical protein